MRSMDQATPALHRNYRSFISKTTLTAFTILASASFNLMADHAISVPTTDLCPADTVGATLNCVSNDVTIALVTAEDENTVCIHGQTAMLNLNTQMEINAASARHDIAAWIPTTGELGKNMLLTSASGGPVSCQSKGFHFPITADDSATVLVEDLDGDSCGDVNGINDTFTRPFTNATVNCDGTVGGAEVDAVVSWHLSGNDPVCSDHQDYGNFKKSKCSNTRSFVDLIVVGKLTVCKAAAPTDVDFGFTIESGTVWTDGTGADDVPTLAAAQFNLSPENGGDCETFDVLTAQGEDLNEVTITETNVPEGWGVSDVSCINNADGGAPAAFTDNGDGFTIGLTEGNLGEEFGVPGQPDVTCTVTNTEGGSITIIKDAVPNGEQDFNFSVVSSEFSDGFTLDDDGNGGIPNSITFDNLDAGDYTFTESATFGWDLTGLSCTASDGESSSVTSLIERKAVVSLVQGGEVMCTFTNTQHGAIRVSKTVFPTGDSTPFTYSGEIDGVIIGGQSTGKSVSAGQYNVMETVPAGWDLDSLVCDDNNSTGDTGTATATFNVEPGEEVNCVFTNVKQGTIVINKTANGGDAEFRYDLSWPNGGGTSVGSIYITTTGGSGTNSFTNLSASDVIENTYYLWENLLEFWEFGSVACTDPTGAPENPLAIDLDPGETVTCEYVNNKNAFITVRKEAFGLDDEFCFLISGPLLAPDEYCFATDGGEGELMSGAISSTVRGFGTWNIVELGPEPPWMLIKQSCDDGQDPAEFEVEPGDNITCTFVNDFSVPVPVNNILALLLMTLLVLATGWYFRPEQLRKL